MMSSTDSQGKTYWWLDLPAVACTRMYVHTPPPPRRSRAKKGQWDTPAGKWEIGASSVEGLQAVMEALTGSRKRCDKQLIAELDGIVVELTERAEAEERRRRATARLRLDVGVIMDDGIGRSRRARRDVKYTFDDFDELIGEAVKAGKRSRSQAEPSTTRRQPMPPPVYDTTGLRRGRSGAPHEQGSEHPDSPRHEANATADESASEGHRRSASGSQDRESNEGAAAASEGVQPSAPTP